MVSETFMREVAHHESGHCIAMLAAGQAIRSVGINSETGAGMVKGEKLPRRPRPGPSDLQATAACAVDFAGVAAGKRYRTGAVVRDLSDEDIERRGGAGDMENFQARASIICDREDEIAALRIRAIRHACGLVNIFWACVTEVATDLLQGRYLIGADVREAIRRAPNGLVLLGEKRPRDPERIHQRPVGDGFIQAHPTRAARGDVLHFKIEADGSVVVSDAVCCRGIYRDAAQARRMLWGR